MNELERLGSCVDFQHRRRKQNTAAEALADNAMDTTQAGICGQRFWTCASISLALSPMTTWSSRVGQSLGRIMFLASPLSRIN